MRKLKYVHMVTTDTAVSVATAAKALQITRASMRNYLYEGLFTTLKFQGFTLVDPQEIDAWKACRSRAQ